MWKSSFLVCHCVKPKGDRYNFRFCWNDKNGIYDLPFICPVVLSCWQSSLINLSSCYRKTLPHTHVHDSGYVSENWKMQFLQFLHFCVLALSTEYPVLTLISARCTILMPSVGPLTPNLTESLPKAGFPTNRGSRLSRAAELSLERKTLVQTKQLGCFQSWREIESWGILNWSDKKLMRTFHLWLGIEDVRKCCCLHWQHAAWQCQWWWVKRPKQGGCAQVWICQFCTFSLLAPFFFVKRIASFSQVPKIAISVNNRRK